jgi:hypothetical protein
MNMLDANNSYCIDESDENSSIRSIQQDLLQISLDRSKLQALGPSPTTSSSGAPTLRTAHRRTAREANAMCRLQREADCERMDLPIYSDELKSSKLVNSPPPINKRNVSSRGSDCCTSTSRGTQCSKRSDSSVNSAMCREQMSSKLNSLEKDHEMLHQLVSASAHRRKDASIQTTPTHRSARGEEVTEPLYIVITAFPHRQRGNNEPRKVTGHRTELLD